jgi:tyrosyl-tRNA synthetase
MHTEQKLALISEVGEEILTEQELVSLLDTKKKPIAYDGFEPSGKIHIAQGLLRAINVNKMTKAGIQFKMLAADWHAWTNKKYGGDLEKIGVAAEYLIEVWKKTGMDMKQVEFIRGRDVVKEKGYWEKVVNVAINSSIKRILRTSQIMGRTEQESLYASQIFYPCMQTADIFQLKADITQLGMDQRKVNVLARELGEKLGYWKPVVVSHHMLLGLSGVSSDKTGVNRAIEMKMSKSNPNSAIFMTDSEKEIRSKIIKAHCVEKELQDNPILEYCKYMVFEMQKKLIIERPSKFGGDVSYSSFSELEKDYAAGDLHPADLKNATATAINSYIHPVRTHFEKNARARSLLERVNAL